MPQQRQSPYGNYGTVGVTGDILQDILAQRELQRIAAAKAAYEQWKDAQTFGFRDREIDVTEGRLGLDRGKQTWEEDKYRQEEPDRAATRRNTNATAAKTEQGTEFERDDRTGTLGLIRTLPTEGRDGLMSPQALALLKYQGKLDLMTPDAQDAIYGPTARGTQAGQKIAATSAGGGLATRQAEAAVDVAKANQIAQGAAEAKGDGAGGGIEARQEQYITERKNRVQSSVRDLAGRVGPNTVGWGSLLAYAPGSPAADFAADVEKLKSAIALGELTEMRAASKTGGALGSTSNEEISLLQNALGAISNTRQSPENYKKNLQDIFDSVERWHKAKEDEAASRGTRAGRQGVGTDLMPKLTFDAAANAWTQGETPAAAAPPASNRTWRR